jgi:hypothetical protein
MRRNGAKIRVQFSLTLSVPLRFVVADWAVVGSVLIGSVLIGSVMGSR